MNFDKLKGHIPDTIYNQLHTVQVLGVDGPKRLSHLLGEAKHETGGWSRFVENLNYSAQGLAKTWPNRYAVDPKAAVKEPNALALKLEHKPEAIANNCYANRNGNGDEASGDGYKFRGRGCIQLTGKSNYKAFGDSITVDLTENPDPVATDYALASAAYFFKSHNLWTICDEGVTEDTCKKVCKVVNGGVLGLAERTKYTQEFYNLLTGTI